MGTVYVGTSGWHYKHWLGNFYPKGFNASRMLSFYCERFDTVEINNSFYHLPTERSLSHWRNSTPEHFHFAAKGSRFLTHMKKLKDAGPGVLRFLEAIKTLDPKLGPILFQLPPNWEIDVERLKSFLQIWPSDRPCAFEFRNLSWNTNQVEEILTMHNAAYCIYDLAGVQTKDRVTADFVYIRLHGPGGKYQGSYSDAFLKALADKVLDWKHRLRAVYVYFDNDDSGYAPLNALRLRELLS